MILPRCWQYPADARRPTEPSATERRSGVVNSKSQTPGGAVKLETTAMTQGTQPGCPVPLEPPESVSTKAPPGLKLPIGGIRAGHTYGPVAQTTCSHRPGRVPGVPRRAPMRMAPNGCARAAAGRPPEKCRISLVLAGSQSGR